MSVALKSLFLATVLLFGSFSAMAHGSIFVFAQVADTEPPVLTVPSDIVSEATGADGATITFTASATDDVDGQITPTCVPPSNSLFPLGNTTVTCTATDSANNTSSASFNIIIQDTTAPSITAPADITVAAGSNSTDVLTENPTVTDIVDSVPTVTNNAPATFLQGQTVVTWTATDFSGNTASVTQTVNTTDTTSPEITAEFVPLRLEEEEGTFKILFSVVDNVDPSPETEAEVNGVSVVNDQIVLLKVSANEFDHEISGGILKFEAPSFVLTVNSTDSSGNEASVSVAAVFEFPPEEIPEELITIEDLQQLLLELELTSPDDIKNLGEQVSKFLFLSKILFDQEKLEIKELRKELQQQIKDADPADRKIIAKEIRDTIKDKREQFKDLRSQWKELFHDFREGVKDIIKENRDVQTRLLEQEIEKTKIDFETSEEKLEKESQEEQRLSDLKNEKRKQELIQQMFSRIATLDASQSKKQDLAKFLDLKKSELEFKDIQKFQKELKNELRANQEKQIETQIDVAKDNVEQLRKEIKKEQDDLRKELKAELENKLQKLDLDDKLSTKSIDKITAFRDDLEDKLFFAEELRKEIKKKHLKRL